MDETTGYTCVVLHVDLDCFYAAVTHYFSLFARGFLGFLCPQFHFKCKLQQLLIAGVYLGDP
jgi:hypothetical protein